MEVAYRYSFEHTLRCVLIVDLIIVLGEMTSLQTLMITVSLPIRTILYSTYSYDVSLLFGETARSHVALTVNHEPIIGSDSAQTRIRHT